MVNKWYLKARQPGNKPQETEVLAFDECVDLYRKREKSLQFVKVFQFEK